MTAGTGLSFRDATDADDFFVIVTAGGGTMPTGTIVTSGGSQTFTAASGTQSSVTVSGLDNAVTSVEVIATVFQSDRSAKVKTCLLYTSPSPRDATLSRMPSSA